MFYASFVHIVYAKLGQASAGDNQEINYETCPWVGSNQDQKSSTLPLLRPPICDWKALDPVQ